MSERPKGALGIAEFMYLRKQGIDVFYQASRNLKRVVILKHVGDPVPYKFSLDGDHTLFVPFGVHKDNDFSLRDMHVIEGTNSNFDWYLFHHSSDAEAWAKPEKEYTVQLTVHVTAPDMHVAAYRGVEQITGKNKHSLYEEATVLKR